MSWKKGTATDYNDLILQIKDFCTKTTDVSSVTAASGNTGDGIVYGESTTEDAVAETWTLTCTTGGSDPVFSVVGSVSGSQASATQHVPYSNAYISFTIIGGATGFAVNDVFSIVVASSTAEWAVDRYDTTDSTSHELIMHGSGAGSDEIYIGLKGRTDSSSYYNIELQGFTGYSSVGTWAQQPAYDDTTYQVFYILCKNVSFDFYLWMSSRRIIVIPIMTTVIEHAYLGWIVPTGSPSQNAYPLFIGGSCNRGDKLTSDISDWHTAYWSCYSDEQSGKFLDFSTWSMIEEDDLFPLNYGYFDQFGVDVNGNYPIFPVTLLDFPNSKVFGDLDGVYYPATNQNTLATYDVIIRSDQAFLCMQDTFRTGDKNMAAFDLK